MFLSFGFTLLSLGSDWDNVSGEEHWRQVVSFSIPHVRGADWHDTSPMMLTESGNFDKVVPPAFSTDRQSLSLSKHDSSKVQTPDVSHSLAEYN